MQNAATKTASRKPPIHISEDDYDIIADLALGIEARSPAVSRLLLDEINRAKVHAPGKLPKNVVSLGSEVEFLDEGTGQRRTVRLVLPAEADIESGKVSIITPMGAGLVGMSEGRSIEWPHADGRSRTLQIVRVNQKP